MFWHPSDLAKLAKMLEGQKVRVCRRLYLFCWMPKHLSRITLLSFMAFFPRERWKLLPDTKNYELNIMMHV